MSTGEFSVASFACRGKPRSSLDNESTKQNFKKYVVDYKKNFRHFLLTSRFNNETWNENNNYRSRNPNINCIYCSPDPISRNIPIDSIAFILEMNNDTNKIIGIGMIRNHPQINKFSVYNDGNYNRYTYSGKIRIDRNNMTEEEDRIMKVFDILCFTGNTHMKRGQGLKSFPVDMLYRCSVKMDLVQFVREMFKKRLT
jgi:hypothetical protein